MNCHVRPLSGTIYGKITKWDDWNLIVLPVGITEVFTSKLGYTIGRNRS
jgi:hypothetical protein